MPPVVGLDLGSVSTKGVALSPAGEIAACFDAPRGAAAADGLTAFLSEVERTFPGVRVRLGAAASGEPDRRRRATFANAILAVGAGARRLHPGARTVIEVGGHTSKLLVLGDDGLVRDFATNEACAAGTGSFLEQQARRLGLAPAELAELAAGAPRAATVAGRCSVFAASDMIHLQQKGTPLPEIAYGLCVAIARNCSTTLLKGREVRPPVVLAGGCARSRGLLRAFAEVLGLHGGRLAPSAMPGLEGAIGAALEAAAQGAPLLSPPELRSEVATLVSASGRTPATLPPLRRPASAPRNEEPSTPSTVREGWLGIDVGSVSTDLVVLDREGEVVSAVYLPTRGRPAEALLEGLAALASRLDPAFRVLGCGTTGSARYLAAKLARADVVKNEITCQLLGARRFVPDVDTIFEIGGQDSKFIAVRDGAIADFAMNKVCAAGTGSFLEEQARALGIDVFRDFAARAFAAEAPLDLGSRCTVFMETEGASALAAGASLEAVSAGLANSIARNYLEKVVGARPLGERIVFSGGVASNAAVVAAFESLLGVPIRVHPWNRISGAIGAALAAKRARREPREPSLFAGFAAVESPKLRSFECRRCANRCEVNVIRAGRTRAFFGDTCERYTSGSAGTETTVPSLAEEWRERCEALFGAAEGPGLVVGVPRATSLAGALPFWATFFRELGHRPVLSRATSQETLAQGLKHLSVGMCLPIKLTAGHVHELVRSGADHVFVPAVVVLPGDGPSFACPYTMAVPFIVGAPRGAKVLAPVVSFESEEAFLEGLEPCREPLGASKEAMRAAYRAAVRAQERMEELFRERARALIAAGEGRHVFAVLGRPYALFDGYVNLGLFERLRRLGILAVPLPFLPLPEGERPRSPLPWRHPADIHSAARLLAEAGDGAGRELHPVLLSSFGCGPDAFTLRQAEEALAGRPHLVLELDEHRGEAGLVTRVEAFLDQLGASPRCAPARAVPRPAEEPFPSRPSVVRIPYFADHAFAFSGLFRFKGHDARVLPLPGPESRALGERHALGKECHAYAMIAGDLLKLRADGAEPGTIFYFPGTSLPCLLHEYGRGMAAMLRELGIDGLRVLSPSGTDLVAAVGLDAAERLYVGILAIELLVKAVCQVRPYELEEGATDRAHRANLARIEEAVAGGDVYAALGESLKSLAAVPVAGERVRPVVGLAGDVYTKVNPAENDDLVRWLEGRGLEVWPSPFQIDLLDFGISRRLYRSVATLDFGGLLVHGALALRRAVDLLRVRSVVGSRVARFEEPGYLEMRKLAAPYMPNEAHELLFVNVAKIVDFARGGADGIVNAICFGCMMGNASAAVVERIRRDHDDVPIVTAVYAGGDDPARRMALDAFVGQVKAHRARRAAAAREGLLAGWLRRA